MSAKIETGDVAYVSPEEAVRRRKIFYAKMEEAARRKGQPKIEVRRTLEVVSSRSEGSPEPDGRRRVGCTELISLRPQRAVLAHPVAGVVPNKYPRPIGPRQNEWFVEEGADYALIGEAREAGLINSRLCCSPRIATLVAQCLLEDGIPLSAINTANRKAEVVNARQHLMYNLRTKGQLSYPIIGRLFGRDHTTAIHGAQMYAARHGLPQPDPGETLRNIQRKLKLKEAYEAKLAEMHQ